MVMKRRCFRNKTFLLGSIVWNNKVSIYFKFLQSPQKLLMLLTMIHTAGWRIISPFSTAGTGDVQTARTHRGIVHRTGIVDDITVRVHSLWINQIGIDTRSWIRTSYD